MLFTIKEIENYLNGYITIEEAKSHLSVENIIAATKAKSYKDEEDIEKYEVSIGMFALKEEQLRLRRKSRGTEGKTWLALSPKWVKGQFTDKTEYRIIYWVNYGDGNTYGWFTVEKIKQWLSTPELQLHTLGGTLVSNSSNSSKYIP